MNRLSEHERKICRRVLGAVRGYCFDQPGIHVYLVGSRATGRARDTSDFDFVLDAGSPIDFDDYAALKQICKEITLHGIDLVDWHRASADFKMLAGPERLEITPELVMGA
jgi:hypothetical protein